MQYALFEFAGRPCVRCGKEFFPLSRKVIYCSPECAGQKKAAVAATAAKEARYKRKLKRA
jgi:hypothetical protein